MIEIALSVSVESSWALPSAVVMEDNEDATVYVLACSEGKGGW